MSGDSYLMNSSIYPFLLWPQKRFLELASQGGGNFFMTLGNAVKAAQVYALIALEICNQSKAVTP